MFVFFPEDPKIGIKNIKVFCHQMQDQNVTRAIIVVQGGLTPSAKQVMSTLLCWHRILKFRQSMT